MLNEKEEIKESNQARVTGLEDLNERQEKSKSFGTQQNITSKPLGMTLQLQHNEQQRAVVEAFRHAWTAYKKYAWVGLKVIVKSFIGTGLNWRSISYHGT